LAHHGLVDRKTQRAVANTNAQPQIYRFFSFSPAA
jgi:hypothetical protein